MKVKICGITRATDAEAADAAGADYLGFVASPGFGRSVGHAALTRLGRGARATRVAVLVDEDLADAVRAARALDAGVLQLHGSESEAFVRGLRDRGDWRLWKAVRVDTVDQVVVAVDRYGPLVDALLIEGRLEGVVGGGGARLSPQVLERLRSYVPAHLEVVLAGGLTPETVGAAIRTGRPDVVDVSSGVESTPGRKDASRVRLFVGAARAAAETLQESMPQPGMSKP